MWGPGEVETHMQMLEGWMTKCWEAILGPWVYLRAFLGTGQGGNMSVGVSGPGAVGNPVPSSQGAPVLNET